MDKTFILEKVKNVKIKNGYLLVGLPGIGLIGKTVADYLIKELKSKCIAEVYSPYFPHQVFMDETGLLKPIKSLLYLIKFNTFDLVILTGSVQVLDSYGQYEYVDKVLSYSKKIGVKTVISVGGYSSGKVGKHKSIFALVTDKKDMPKLKKHKIIFGKAVGSIVGSAGLLPTFSKNFGMNGICLLGETHGAYVDSSSARDIVKLLSTYLGFEISLNRLERQAKEGEKAIRKIEEEIKKEHTNPTILSNDTSYIR